MTFLHLDDLAQPGVYRVERPDQVDMNFPLAVNVPRGRSFLQAMDAKTLEQWWAPAECVVSSDEAFGKLLDDQGSGWPLWPTLMLLAGLLLLAETIYVHRLCPRRNPDVVESAVPRRGMLKPMVGKIIDQPAT